MVFPPVWLRSLHWLNLVAAVILALAACDRLLADRSWVGVVLLGGLLIVGPLEDWLKRRRHLPADVIDQATSLGLIIALIAATLLAD
ncbi:MAG TPA: hypothetical protein VIL95_07880 [Bacillota bacterium]